MCILSQLKTKTTKEVFFVILRMFVTLQVGTLSGITAELLCPEEKRRNMPLVYEGKISFRRGPADYVSQLPLASWVSYGKRIWKTNFDSLWRAAGFLERTRG